MAKPNDIPQHIWDAAYEASFRGEWWVVEKVARAMLAAVEDEREVILDAASVYLQEQYGLGVLRHPVDRARIAAIRNRKEA